MRALFLGLFVLGLSGCVRTCVGTPELGSKERPVRFLVPADRISFYSWQARNKLENCLEEVTGYRVSFDVAADDRAISTSLRRLEAEFGLLGSLSYADLRREVTLKPQVIISVNGSPATRRILVGKTEVWEQLREPQDEEDALEPPSPTDPLFPLTEGTVSYVSAEGDADFLVPQRLLGQRNIRPKNEIFSGSPEDVIRDVLNEKAVAGFVPAETLQPNEGSESLPDIGSTFEQLVVLDVTAPIPHKIVVSRPSLRGRVIDSTLSGLQICASSQAADAFEILFQGSGTLDVTRTHAKILSDFLNLMSDPQLPLAPEE